ncbi:MAG TPA: hypothetical protein VFB90_07215 [Dehalococcoidia bacterium]|nr:hypothetical protein [Dehalococcoidia bacterium]
MLWTTRLNRLTGIVLLLTAIATVLVIVFGMNSDADPFKKTEIDDFLRDIDDNRKAMVFGLAVDVVIHSGLGLALAGLLYLLFRGRDRLLALFGFGFLLAAFIASIASGAINAALILVAHDFVKGGPGGMAAGDPAILEVGRALAVSSILVDQSSLTAFGLAVLSFGALITWAPLGAGANPPRWLGWFAMLGGLAFVLSWLIAITDAAFVLFIVGGLASLIWMVVLGVWLLRTPDAAPQTA